MSTKTHDGFIVLEADLTGNFALGLVGLLTDFESGWWDRKDAFLIGVDGACWSSGIKHKEFTNLLNKKDTHRLRMMFDLIHGNCNLVLNGTDLGLIIKNDALLMSG